MTEQLTVVYIHISENCREAGPTQVLFSSKGSTATGLWLITLVTLVFFARSGSSKSGTTLSRLSSGERLGGELANQDDLRLWDQPASMEPVLCFLSLSSHQ
jgi:hypothetical protein